MNEKKTIDILLVEDYEDHVGLIRRVFESSKSGSVNLTFAKTVQEARKILAESTPDLAIIDYKLPDGEGIELLQPKPSYPTIIMTGQGDEELAVASLKAGALDYCVKSEEMFRNMPHTAERVLREWENIIGRKQAEEALHSANASFLNILESMEDGVYIVNQDYDIEFINYALKKEFGPPEGKKCYDYFHNRQEACPWCKNQDVFAGKTVRWEWHSPRNQKTYDLIDTPITNEDGHISKLEIFRDITERKRMEETLRKLSRAMEQSPTSVIITDIEGKIEYANPKFTELTGYTQEEVLGENPRILKSGEKSSDEYKNLWETITSGKEWHGEFHNKKKNGELYWEFASISAIKNEDGKITHFLAVKEDITGRKQMEEEIRYKSELIQLMYKITITANEVSTVDGAMQICLDNICSYAGWSVGHVYFLMPNGKLIPSKLWHLDSPEQFKKFREITEFTSFDPGFGLPGRVLANGKPVWITDVTKDPDFTRAMLAKDINVKAGFAFPVLEGKKVVAVLEFFSKEAKDPDKSLLDTISILATQLGRVTERKRAENEAKRMQIKMLASSKLATLGEVSTGIAHEINQPLTYISSLIQTLKLNTKDRSIGEKELEKKLEFASGQVKKIISIINHLRTFGRRYDVMMEKVDIGRVLENTILLLGERIRLRNIRLVSNTEEKLPIVWGNANQLEQVFINLFQNSIDALQFKKENSEIRLDISISTERKAVQIKFSDNGHGMPESIREKVFEPFFTTKEVGRGTGLGLSITYGIIREHKGQITCESQMNKGTTFTIKIPVDKK